MRTKTRGTKYCWIFKRFSSPFL